MIPSCLITLILLTLLYFSFCRSFSYLLMYSFSVFILSVLVVVGFSSDSVSSSSSSVNSDSVNCDSGSSGIT